MSASRMIKIDRGRIHPNMTEDEIQSLALDMMAQMTSAEIRIWEPPPSLRAVPAKRRKRREKW